MKRFKKNSSSFKIKTRVVNDEIFAVISSCASVLTECQDYNHEAYILATNLWNLYHRYGGHYRLPSVIELDLKLQKDIL